MDKILAPIKQRIVKYIDFQKINKDVFFKKIEVSASNFRSKSLYSEVGGDVIAKILAEFVELNPNWLLTGKGEMLLKKPIAAPAVDQVPDAGNVHAVELLEKEVASLKEALKEAYKENGRLEWQLEQANKDIITLKKSGSGVGVSELKNK